MHEVYLLLGSNLGDRHNFLRQAIILIEKEIAPVVKTSSVYETQSWGKAGLPDYLNQVICLETNLPPIVLLNKILHIEQQIGRIREEKWGSRVIDVDILFYGDTIINQPGLQVPHPQLQNRRFTLEPLAEIAPLLVHPVIKKKIFQLKNELNDGLIVKKL